MQKLEYKGFTGSYEYDAEFGVYFGTVDGVDKFVNFHAENEDELDRYFREAVEEYIVKYAPAEWAEQTVKPIIEDNEEKNTKPKKKKSKLTVIIVLLLLAVIGYCGYRVVDKLLEYKASRDAYDKMKQEAVIDSNEIVEIGEDGEPLDEEEKEERKKVLGPVLDIDWDALGDKCVGWFLMDDISYPIMYSGDNEYFLHKLPDGTYNYGGSLFLAGENKKDFTDENSIIYGHNMNDGSMFGKLKKYAKAEYGSRSFYVFLPDGTRHTYAFFTILAVESGHDAYGYSFSNKKAFVDYQKNMQKISLYNSGIQPSEKHKIVSLSTCNGAAGTNNRVIIQGVKTEVKRI